MMLISEPAGFGFSRRRSLMSKPGSTPVPSRIPCGGRSGALLSSALPQPRLCRQGMGRPTCAWIDEDASWAVNAPCLSGRVTPSLTHEHNLHPLHLVATTPANNYESGNTGHFLHSVLHIRSYDRHFHTTIQWLTNRRDRLKSGYTIPNDHNISNHYNDLIVDLGKL